MAVVNQVAYGAQILVAVTTSLQERRPRTLKHGDTFAVFDQNGDATGAPGNPEGIYHRDTRHLSHLLVTIDGLRPILLSSTLRDDNAVLLCDLTNPELAGGAEGAVAQYLLHIHRTRFLWNGRVFERLALRNFDLRPRAFALRIDFEADFADIFEVRGAVRPARGARHPPQIEADAATLSYTGLDRRRRETRIQIEPAPTEIGPSFARFDLRLAPTERTTLFLEIRCGVDYGPRSPRPGKSFTPSNMETYVHATCQPGNPESTTAPLSLWFTVCRQYSAPDAECQSVFL